jgi:cytochrome P450
MIEPSLVESRDLLDRSCEAFALPSGLRELGRQSVCQAVQFPQGMPAWLLCRYSDVRAALIDSERLSSVDAPSRHLLDDYDLDSPVEPGALLRSDGQAHTRLRSRLQGEFTVRRMSDFAPTVQSIVSGQIDRMLEAGSAGDIVAGFARPVSAHAIGALLGVPPQDRDSFVTQVVNDPSPTRMERLGADRVIRGYVSDLLAEQRRSPGDNLLGRLVADNREDQLTHQELVTLATTLLVAAHEATASQIALSVAALLQRPHQWHTMRQEGVTSDAVEELLRFVSVVHRGVLRRCVSPTSAGGRAIARGEYVVASIAAANHDVSWLPDATSLDIHRARTRHLAFGAGPHQCLGQHLARLELRLALSALVARVPSMRLAKPIGPIDLETDLSVLGIRGLQVFW